MSKSLLLNRFTPKGDPRGTLSILTCDNQFITYVAELPWLDNKPFLSCIPDGTYLCKPYISPKHQNTWQITGVKGRDSILNHIGNFVVDLAPEDKDGKADSEGCLLHGLAVDCSTDFWKVTNSTAGFKKFLDYLKDEQSYMLAIKWV